MRARARTKAFDPYECRACRDGKPDRPCYRWRQFVPCRFPIEKGVRLHEGRPMILFCDRAELLALASASLGPAGQIRVALESAGICPVPLLDEPGLFTVLETENAWDAYHTPPFAGAQADQPAALLEGCSTIRHARNLCSIEEMKEQENRIGGGSHGV